ncbi:MAG: hypothetical protein KC420_13055 [Myxococcales bacterium]|nr:hypothetical protein [Myxococcales bacterium]
MSRAPATATRELALALASALTLPVGACVGGESVDRADEDPLCVLPEAPSGLFQYPHEGAPSVSYAADAPLHVAVDHGCIGCKRDLQHGCEVTINGAEIVVTSSIAYEVPGGACDASCELVTSTCASAGPVAAGEYTVRYGDLSAALVIPSDAPATCIDPG